MALPFGGLRYLPVVPGDQPADIGERPAHVLQAERDAVEMGGVGIMAVHDTPAGLGQPVDLRPPPAVASETGNRFA